jgi:GT2 family glycosyltransferase
MTKKNEICIIIPHYNGIEILRNCLKTLYENHFTDFYTIVIDNGSKDGSQDMVRQEFPQVHLIQNESNRGYAGACNQGIAMAESPYVLLLNNDTEMPANFLDEMIQAIKNDPRVAMVQPKILSIQDKSRFDYSGGAGGELDWFGYPFARGRIFDDVEKDTGQYDALDQRVFWTSGCALLLRKSVIEEIGVLDEDFFAHQEEIDLNWRAQLAGYQNIVTTKTHIYHYSGYTLRGDNQRKMYLNHRNNLIMMIKNYSGLRLMLLLPLRLVMEVMTILTDLLFWEGKRARAVVNALIDLTKQIGPIRRKRKQVQKLRRVSDRQIMKNMYPGSIVFAHFLRKQDALECVRKFRKNAASL